VVLAVVAAAACGRGGDDPDVAFEARSVDGRRATEVIASDLLAHPRAELSSGEARCVAAAVVDEIGVDRLTEAGLDDAGSVPELTVPPLTEAEGEHVYRAYDGCLDLTARDVEGFTAAGLTEEQARCASRRYRGSGVAQEHLLLRRHDEVPHEELHARVEAEWDGAQAGCRS
jgi:hypothetical protein